MFPFKDGAVKLIESLWRLSNRHSANKNYGESVNGTLSG